MKSTKKLAITLFLFAFSLTSFAAAGGSFKYVNTSDIPGGGESIAILSVPNLKVTH